MKTNFQFSRSLIFTTILLGSGLSSCAIEQINETIKTAAEQAKAALNISESSDDETVGSSQSTSISSLDTRCITDSSDANNNEIYLRTLLAESIENNVEEYSLAKYLIGLCVPDSIEQQQSLAEQLLTRGASYDFYMEESLHEMALFLQDAGVNMSIRIDSTLADDRFIDAQGIETVEKMLNQEHYYTENVASILPRIERLESEQQEQALQIAGKVRSYALNSIFFNTRGLYISGKVVEEIPEITKLELEKTKVRISDAADNFDIVTIATELRNSLGSSNDQTATTSVMANLQFITTNLSAFVRTLNSGIGILTSLDSEIDQVPRLTEEEILLDMSQINEEWNLPAEFEDIEGYANENPALIDDI